MNFNYQRANLVDVKANYKQITENFIKFYYSLYDTDFLKMGQLYKPDACFTFLDEEMIGFNNLVDKLKQYNITKFTHHSVHVNSQPVGDRTLMLMVSGRLSVNSSPYAENKFMETILLQRDDQNKFFVHHTMFKLVE